MRTKFKAWTKPYIDEHPEVMITMDEMKKLDHIFALEIGSGKGKFLIDMAKKYPNKDFIGVERNVTCSGITAKKLVEEDIKNARLLFENADILLDVIKDGVVENIFLNFSDPWPKKKHAKRRLTAPGFLAKYHRVLASQGTIRIKTDNEALYRFTLENISESPFVLLEYTENYQDLDEFDAMSEYEMNFRESGNPIYRLVVKKND